jgi:hypothetical protein
MATYRLTENAKEDLRRIYRRGLREYGLSDIIREIFYGGATQLTNTEFNRMIIQLNFANTRH